LRSWASFNPAKITLVPDVLLGLDDHLQRLCLGHISERFLGIKDSIELKSMRNEKLGIDLFRTDGLEQHWYRGRIDQPCGDGNIAIP
jgi:hypothetical protein